MEQLSVRVRNPSALRESLQVALEVVWPDLSPEHASCVRRFAKSVPAQVAPASVAVSSREREGLLTCAAYFKQPHLVLVAGGPE